MNVHDNERMHGCTWANAFTYAGAFALLHASSETCARARTRMHACGVRLSVPVVGQLLLGRSHQNEHERFTALTIVTLMVDWL